MEPAYQALVLRMMTKGLSEQEIAVAVESLAQAHLDTLAANAETEAEIDKAQREAGLPDVVEMPAPRDGWMLIAGAALWCALLFPTGYLAFSLILQLTR